jgi:hypothetical protein
VWDGKTSIEYSGVVMELLSKPVENAAEARSGELKEAA